jgi:hypothetical protein
VDRRIYSTNRTIRSRIGKEEMYHAPRHFREEEWFSEWVCKKNTRNGKIRKQIWRLVDSRITWTADALRDYFGPMYMNNWFWGGDKKGRGYRDPREIIDYDFLYRTRGILTDPVIDHVKTSYSSFSSQHCSGRALDATFKGIKAEEIREDIRKNPKARRYRFITCVEDDVSWLHADVRNWERSQSGILFVKP